MPNKKQACILQCKHQPSWKKHELFSYVFSQSSLVIVIGEVHPSTRNMTIDINVLDHYAVKNRRHLETIKQIAIISHKSLRWSMGNIAAQCYGHRPVCLDVNREQTYKTKLWTSFGDASTLIPQADIIVNCNIKSINVKKLIFIVDNYGIFILWSYSPYKKLDSITQIIRHFSKSDSWKPCPWMKALVLSIQNNEGELFRVVFDVSEISFDGSEIYHYSRIWSLSLSRIFISKNWYQLAKAHFSVVLFSVDFAKEVKRIDWFEMWWNVLSQ